MEADASSATYPLAIAAITGGTVTVDGVGRSSLQGDAQFYKVQHEDDRRVPLPSYSQPMRGTPCCCRHRCSS